jgi:hypothetical protein
MAAAPMALALVLMAMHQQQQQQQRKIWMMMDQEDPSGCLAGRLLQFEWCSGRQLAHQEQQQQQPAAMATAQVLLLCVGCKLGYTGLWMAAAVCL